MEENNNIRVLFTARANSALESIMDAFKLEETPEVSIKKIQENRSSNIVTIDHLAKDFALGNISEKNLANSLQKDLEVSQQIAEQISREVITKIVPFLEKAPEEKFKDPAFVEEITKKVFGETVNKNSQPGITQSRMKIKEDEDIFPNIKPQVGDTGGIEKNAALPEPSVDNVAVPPKKQRIKKPIVQEEIKEAVPAQQQSRGPDSYREPIE